MKVVILAFLSLILFSTPAFSYDYERPATEDTFTDNFYPDRNFSTFTKLWAGGLPNKNNDDKIDGKYVARAYFKFDLTDIDNISKAYLTLYRSSDTYTYNDPDYGNLTVYFETESWNAADITWNSNAPNFDNNTAGSTVYVGPSGWFSWDVSSFAKAAQGGYLSLIITGITGTEPFHIFSSNESTTNKPYLGVTMTPEPASILLFGIGGVVMTLVRRRKKTS